MQRVPTTHGTLGKLSTLMVIELRSSLKDGWRKTTPKRSTSRPNQLRLRSILLAHTNAGANGRTGLGGHQLQLYQLRYQEAVHNRWRRRTRFMSTSWVAIATWNRQASGYLCPIFEVGITQPPSRWRAMDSRKDWRMDLPHRFAFASYHGLLARTSSLWRRRH